MIAEAIDTIRTLGLALLVWIAILAAAATPLLLTLAGALWWLLTKTAAVLRGRHPDEEPTT